MSQVYTAIDMIFAEYMCSECGEKFEEEPAAINHALQEHVQGGSR